MDKHSDSGLNMGDGMHTLKLRLRADSYDRDVLEKRFRLI